MDLITHVGRRPRSYNSFQKFGQLAGAARLDKEFCHDVIDILPSLFIHIKREIMILCQVSNFLTFLKNSEFFKFMLMAATDFHLGRHVLHYHLDQCILDTKPS